MCGKLHEEILVESYFIIIYGLKNKAHFPPTVILVLKTHTWKSYQGSLLIFSELWETMQ